jgi:hypothetical protein
MDRVSTTATNPALLVRVLFNAFDPNREAFFGVYSKEFL